MVPCHCSVGTSFASLTTKLGSQPIMPKSLPDHCLQRFRPLRDVQELRPSVKLEYIIQKFNTPLLHSF